MEKFDTIIRQIKELVREVADQSRKDGYRNGVRVARSQPELSTEELLNRLE